MRWLANALRSFAEAFRPSKPRRNPDLEWTRVRVPGPKPVSPEWKSTTYTYSSEDSNGNKAHRPMTPEEKKAFNKAFSSMNSAFNEVQKAFDMLDKSK